MCEPAFLLVRSPQHRHAMQTLSSTFENSIVFYLWIFNLSYLFCFELFFSVNGNISPGSPSSSFFRICWRLRVRFCFLLQAITAITMIMTMTMAITTRTMMSTNEPLCLGSGSSSAKQNIALLETESTNHSVVSIVYYTFGLFIP